MGPQLASNLQNSSYLNLPSAGIPGVLRCITTPRSDTVLSLTSHQGRADCKLSWKTAWEAGQVRSPVSVLPRGARKIQELELGLVSAQGQWLSLSVVFAPQSYTMVGRDAPRSQCLLEERVSWDTRAARCSCSADGVASPPGLPAEGSSPSSEHASPVSHHLVSHL